MNSFKFYTVKDVAEITHYSESSIRNFIRKGILDGHKADSSVRKFLITEDALKRFLRNFE